MMESKAAIKTDVSDDEQITIEYFDSESDVDENDVRYTMYFYNDYRIATKEELNELIEPVPEVRLVLTSEFAEDFPIKVRNIEDALRIINIMEGR